MAIWQVANYWLQTYHVAPPFERYKTLQIPQKQPFAILRVSNWRTLTQKL